MGQPWNLLECGVTDFIRQPLSEGRGDCSSRLREALEDSEAGVCMLRSYLCDCREQPKSISAAILGVPVF